VGVITLINLVDRFSKAKLLSYPCCLGQQQATRHADTEDYQLALRLAASEWGLPDRLYVDRDSVFYDNQSRSPFPTRFHLWMLALGVDVVFGPPSQPTERAMVERNHQTWDRQVLQGQSYREWVVLRDALRQRRDFLNRCLPCASCDGRPPLVAHPETAVPRREYHPEWELQMLDMARVHSYLGQGQWFRKVSNVGTVSLAQQIYTVSRRLAKAEVPITFDPDDQHLVFHVPGGEIAKRLPIKGLTPLFLMGHQGPVPHLDGVQPVLPFITPLPRGDATL